MTRIRCSSLNSTLFHSLVSQSLSRHRQTKTNQVNRNKSSGVRSFLTISHACSSLVSGPRNMSLPSAIIFSAWSLLSTVGLSPGWLHRVRLGPSWLDRKRLGPSLVRKWSVASVRPGSQIPQCGSEYNQ